MTPEEELEYYNLECERITKIVEKHLSNTPERLQYLKSGFACNLAFTAANYGSYNFFEALGILEEAKLNYREISEEIRKEEDNQNQQ